MAQTETPRVKVVDTQLEDVIIDDIIYAKAQELNKLEAEKKIKSWGYMRIWDIFYIPNTRETVKLVFTVGTKRGEKRLDQFSKYIKLSKKVDIDKALDKFIEKLEKKLKADEYVFIIKRYGDNLDIFYIKTKDPELFNILTHI